VPSDAAPGKVEAVMSSRGREGVSGIVLTTVSVERESPVYEVAVVGAAGLIGGAVGSGLSAGDRQVADCELCLVTGYGGAPHEAPPTVSYSGLLLAR